MIHVFAIIHEFEIDNLIIDVLEFYSCCCSNFLFFSSHSQGKGTKLRGALTKVVSNSPRTAGKGQGLNCKML